MAPRVTDPFFKKLHIRLLEEIDKRASSLINGGAFVRGDKGLLVDPINTASKYEKDVAVIKAYQDIIELGLEIDREMFGTKHIEDGDD